MRISILLNVALAGLLAAAIATPVFTQAPVTESALLIEVRLLRQAIEALAGNGSRIQLVFGRLQLQEQRTTAAARRLDDVRSALAHQNVALGTALDRMKQLAESAADTRRASDELQALQDTIAQMKLETARMEAERVRLVTEEGDAAQALALEQGRWSELNREVEELERALTKPRQ